MMMSAMGANRANLYEVLVGEENCRWRVVIRDPAGVDVARRTCASAEEARTYSSTVRQHIFWLSEPKFREYYRLPELS